MENQSSDAIELALKLQMPMCSTRINWLLAEEAARLLCPGDYPGLATGTERVTMHVHRVSKTCSTLEIISVHC
jgi:hypothetical protein